MSSIEDPMKTALARYRRRKYRVSSGKYRPTEASCEITDPFGDKQRVGKCRRAIYYRKIGTPSSPFTDNTLLTFSAGNAMEDYFCELWKEAGILIDQDIPCLGTGESNGIEIPIVGAIDGLLRNCEATPGDQYSGGDALEISTTEASLMEFKTARGISIEEAVSTRSGIIRYPSPTNALYPNGIPKMAYAMQLGLYLNFKESLEKHYGVEITEGLLCYAGLKPQVFTNFRLHLEGDEGNIIIEDKFGKVIEPSVAYLMRPGISDDLMNQGLTPIEGLSIDGIMASFAYVIDHLERKEVPARDFQLRWSKEYVERGLETGMLLTGTGKKNSHVTRWEKNGFQAVGSFECHYCDFSDTCYPLGSLTEAVEDGEMTEGQAIQELKDAGIRLPIFNP